MTVSLGLVGGFVLLGAATQRVTGMGFALIASPFLVMILGVAAGIPLTQVLSSVASTLVLFRVWRDVEIRKALALLVPGIIGIVPGWWLSKQLPAPVLAITIGALVIVALLALVADERARVFRGRPGLMTAGFLSGFMNVTAGVGGPAIVLYALSVDWPHHRFVATVQVYFIALNIGSLIAQGWPGLDTWTWGVAIGALVGGLFAGELLSKRVDAGLARKLVIVVALLGSLATVVKGVLALS